MVTPLQVVPQPPGTLVVVAEGVGFIHQHWAVVGILVGQKNAMLSPFYVFVFLRLRVECKLRRCGYSAVGDDFGPKLVAPVELLPHWHQARWADDQRVSIPGVALPELPQQFGPNECLA